MNPSIVQTVIKPNKAFTACNWDIMWDQHDMAGDAAMNLNNMNGYYFLSSNLDSGG